MLEEESDPARFSIHRLGHYCLDLAELCKTDRVVPVVVFLRGDARIRKRLELGSENHAFLSFRYLFCILNEMPAEQFRDSDNIVARLNLPNMAYVRQAAVDVFAWAFRGLLELEPDMEKRLKYMDFIDIYSRLTDNERELFAEQYPQEKQTMMTWSERVRSEGVQQGELAVLIRQLTCRFGPLDPVTDERLRKAKSVELEQWAENILDARTLEDVFSEK
ncbi:DUF4351 domain-containing protein [Thauera sp.]|uniref:DUF4351 domain-containing protein n=1 Tax=Thauera sp. TaxID=1905334 RepID=UPI0039E58978